MNLRDLATRIRDKREKQRLRQADIAGALQVSTQAVSKWERGENAPDISLLVPLSKVLDCSVEWLLTGNVEDTDTFAATVICTSLNGFAQKSARMTPREVATWANSIYYPLTEALLRFGGVPVKYVGDGFLGFFAGTDHPDRALESALYARKLVETNNLIIALNSGDIYLGTIGHPDYATSDIIGDTVNTAFLAMNWIAKNCKSGVGLTGNTYDILRENEGVVHKGAVKLELLKKNLDIYEP